MVRFAQAQFLPRLKLRVSLRRFYEIDHLAESFLGRGRYFRYVDDMVLIGESLDDLRDVARIIDAQLNSIGLALNHHKTAHGLLSQGVDFVGFFVLPRRIRVRNGTYRRHVACIRKSAQTLRSAMERGALDCVVRERKVQASRIGALRSPLRLITTS